MKSPCILRKGAPPSNRQCETRGFGEDINPANKCTNSVMPDSIPAEHGIFDRHPVHTWIPAFAGMTILGYLIAGVIDLIGFG
jgi:hypothetical protein